MKDKIVVGGSTVSAGQLEDFFRQIKDGSIGNGEMQAILEHRNPWEKIVSRWTEENGVITFTLPPTDGTTGELWIKRTEKKGNRVGDYVKQLLLSKDFKPTTGVTYTVKVLKGELFSDSDRISKNIRAEAKKRKLSNLNAEAACLIRENFTDEELKAMGLYWIVVMHEPIKDSDGDLGLLCVDRGNDGRWLDGCYDFPGNRWNCGNGLAFSVV